MVQPTPSKLPIKPMPSVKMCCSAGLTLVLSESNIHWADEDEPVDIEKGYSRNPVTGRNKTNARTAMGSICAQVRAAVKKKYTEQMNRERKSAIDNGESPTSSRDLDGSAYEHYVREVFTRFDVDNNQFVDKRELLIGLFSLGVQLGQDEAELLVAMFAGKEGFTYEQFCRMVISGDTTRRKKSDFLPALQREEALLKMARVSKQRRVARIKNRTKR